MAVSERVSVINKKDSLGFNITFSIIMLYRASYKINNVDKRLISV